MNYHTDTKEDSDASSYSVRDSFQEARQSMEGYDPNRIPLSVFSSKPSNHPEWSLASSESLFSITLGKSFESNFPVNYKSSTIYRNMEATDISAITTDSQIQYESQEMQLSRTAFVDASEPTMQPKFFHPNRDTIAQENFEEKRREEEGKTSTQEIDECLVLEPVSDDETSEEDALTQVGRIKITGSNSMQRNREMATFQDLRLSKTALVDASKPTIDAKNLHLDTNTITKDNVKKIKEKKERISSRVMNKCSVLEMVSGNEIREDKASFVDRTTGSISMQRNQDLITSFSIYRFKDRSGIPYNQPMHPKEIEIGDVQPETVNQAPNATSSGWLSCLHFSWKSLCCGGL